MDCLFPDADGDRLCKWVESTQPPDADKLEHSDTIQLISNSWFESVCNEHVCLYPYSHTAQQEAARVGQRVVALRPPVRHQTRSITRTKTTTTTCNYYYFVVPLQHHKRISNTVFNIPPIISQHRDKYLWKKKRFYNCPEVKTLARWIRFCRCPLLVAGSFLVHWYLFIFINTPYFVWFCFLSGWGIWNCTGRLTTTSALDDSNWWARWEEATPVEPAEEKTNRKLYSKERNQLHHDSRSLMKQQSRKFLNSNNNEKKR